MIYKRKLFLLIISFFVYISVDAAPQLVVPKYGSNETIIADFVLSPSSDITQDRTNDIQSALNQCKSNHGGTVYLKHGIYRVSKTILIPRNCTLHGDWQDPAIEKSNYGTIITVDVNNVKYDSSDYEKTGLFKMSSGSGAIGLTFYYLNQGYTLSTFKDQPWTFYYAHGELDWAVSNNDFYRPILYTIKNVTLLNSYRGIGESLTDSNFFEMLEIENVKGTAIYKGVVVHNSSDVGTITGLSLTPHFWINANLSALKSSNRNPNWSELVGFMQEISSIGLYLTDAEMYQFANIELMGFKYGIYIPGSGDISFYKIPRRNMGSGLIYNLKISHCIEGIHAGDDYFVHHSLGYQISNSSIEGSNYSIYNASKNAGQQTGVFKLLDVKLVGKTYGFILYNNDLSENYSEYNGSSLSSSKSLSNLFINRNTKTTGTTLVVLNANSSENEIQNALNNVGKTGGVVYLKPGLYNVTKQIVIPENVELRGSSSVLSRFAGKPGSKEIQGTVINIDPKSIGTKYSSAIELAGNNSGVSGIVFIYEKNNSLMQGSSSNYIKSAPTIGSHNTEHVFITNVTISGAAYGIGIDSCKYFTINNVASTTFDNFISVVNSKSGLIKNTLGNSTVLSLNNYYYFNPGYFINLINTTHSNLVYIELKNSENIESLNNFIYGPHTYMAITNSTGYFINNGNDSWPDISNKLKLYMYNIYNSNKSNVVIVNSHRYNGNNGELYTVTGSGNTINIYNSLYMKSSIADNSPKYEKNIVGGKLISPITSSSIPKYVMKKALIGDVNGDNKVNSTDYIAVRKHILKQTKLTGQNFTRGDLNGDNKITSLDYIAIRKIILKKG